MHWIERLNDPLAPDREGAIRYMRGEIERALPEGWALRSDEGRDLTWRIERTSPPPENGIDRDYLVELTADLRRVIFTWGNRPAGPFDLHFCLLQASVIWAQALRHFGMAECLRAVMSCPPNEWGLT